MSLITTGVFWGVIALSIAIAVSVIAGARVVVYRMAGRGSTYPVDVQDAFSLPAFPAQGVRRFAWSVATMGLLAIATAIVLLRFVYGIGSVTNLSDHFAWGLWIGFDVMSGVALAAGAFVIAGTAHILHIERFKPLVRPAILTGLLGYLLVIAGLIVDLGRPYNVWRPLVHWQHHSPLWEVGCCVALYTTVLMIEFSPVVLERVKEWNWATVHLPVNGLYGLLTKLSIGFVILGVVLSTLHQSSLGSLWVLVPTKLHPLWYSIYLPVFFWLSAIAVGLTMTIVESTLSSKAFHRGLESDLLQALGKAAAIVLVVYLAARTADLVARDAWPLLFEPTLQAGAYWLEIVLGIVVPTVIFAVRPLRKRPALLFTAALMVVVFGIVLNRLNVGITGLLQYTGMIYAPSWMEITVSLAFVCLGVLVFALAAKYLPVFPPEEEHHA